MQRRTWFDNWLAEDTEKKMNQVEQQVEEVEAEVDFSLDPSAEVLNTGYTLQEFDQDINNRGKVNRKLRSQIDRHKEKYEQYRDDAVEASGDQKANLYIKAKEQQIKHDTKQKFLDKLSERKLFLQLLRLQHISNQFETPADNVEGVQIDIGELPVDEIAASIDDVDVEEDETQHVMDEVERELDLGPNAGLDVSDIKEDVEEEEAARIDEGTSELEQGIESEIDQEIEEKLEELDDEFQK